MRLPRWIEALPTPAKLLLLLSIALLPIGAILAYTAASALNDADVATRQNARLDASMLSDSIQSLVARNALALRISANAALDGTPGATTSDTRWRTWTLAYDFEMSRATSAAGTGGPPSEREGGETRFGRLEIRHGAPRRTGRGHFSRRRRAIG